MLIDPVGITGLTIQALILAFSFLLTNARQPLSETEKKTVVAVVGNQRVSKLTEELSLYKKNLLDEGWTVFFHITDEATNTTALKKTLDQLYKKHNMQGVVLIGSFPYPDKTADDLSLTFDDSWKSFFPFNVFSYHPRFWLSRIDPRIVAPPGKSSANDELTMQDFILKNYLQRNNALRRISQEELHNIETSKYIYSNLRWHDPLSTLPLHIIPNSKSYFASNGSEFLSFLNSPATYQSIIIAHGNCNCIWLQNEPICGQRLREKSKSPSRLILLNSCSTGCNQAGSPAGALLFAPESKTLAVIAPRNLIGALSYIASTNHDHGATNAGLAFLGKSALSMGTISATLLALAVADKTEGATLPHFIHWIMASIGLTQIVTVIAEQLVHGRSQLVLYGDGTLPIPQKPE